MKTLIFLVLLLLGIGWVVTREKPGSGVKAKAGIRQLTPVVTALESYRQERGGYPGSLQDLVPSFIGSVPREIGGHPLDYDGDANGFTLTFSYTSPLPTHCTYKPSIRWKCSWL